MPDTTRNADLFIQEKNALARINELNDDEINNLKEIINNDIFFKENNMTPKKVLVSKILDTFSEIFKSAGVNSAKISGNTYAIVLNDILKEDEDIIKNTLNDGKEITQLSNEEKILTDKLKNNEDIKKSKDNLKKLINILSDMEFSNAVSERTGIDGSIKKIDTLEDFVDFFSRNLPYVWKYLSKKIKVLNQRNQELENENVLEQQNIIEPQQNVDNNERVELEENVDDFIIEEVLQEDENLEQNQDDQHENIVENQQQVQEGVVQGNNQQRDTDTNIDTDNNKDKGGLVDHKGERDMSELIAFSLTQAYFDRKFLNKYIENAVKVINNPSKHGHQNVVLTVNIRKTDSEKLLESYKFRIGSETHKDKEGNIRYYSMITTKSQDQSANAICKEFEESTINRMKSEINTKNSIQYEYEKMYKKFINRSDEQFLKEEITYNKNSYEKTKKKTKSFNNIFNKYENDGTFITKITNLNTNEVKTTIRKNKSNQSINDEENEALVGNDINEQQKENNNDNIPQTINEEHQTKENQVNKVTLKDIRLDNGNNQVKQNDKELYTIKEEQKKNTLANSYQIYNNI